MPVINEDPSKGSCRAHCPYHVLARCLFRASVEMCILRGRCVKDRMEAAVAIIVIGLNGILRCDADSISNTNYPTMSDFSRRL